jgi:hypothetical protein
MKHLRSAADASSVGHECLVSPRERYKIMPHGSPNQFNRGRSHGLTAMQSRRQKECFYPWDRPAIRGLIPLLCQIFSVINTV